LKAHSKEKEKDRVGKHTQKKKDMAKRCTI
jgi:hypothetical protein